MERFGPPDIERMAAENDHDGLYQCLEHRDKFIRLQAAQALADMEDGVGWRFLFDAVRQEKDPDVQSAAAAMLGELGHHRAVPVLGEVLLKARGEPADAIRNALEAIDTPDAQEALRRAGYEPVLPIVSGTVFEYESHYARPVLPRTEEIRFLTAEEHLNNAVELRESEMAERGLVEDSLALWLKPAWAYAWYLRGVLFEDLERGDEAHSAYRHALTLDPQIAEAREALADLENEQSFQPLEIRELLTDLDSRDWRTRRDAAARFGWIDPLKINDLNAVVDTLIIHLGDEEREVRHAAIETLGRLGSQKAVTPLLMMEESSWLVRFSILQALSQLGSVDGLITALRREMDRIQERNPVFSSNKDPLLEVEYDLLLEIGVRALERAGNLEALLSLAEENAWEEVDEDKEDEVLSESSEEEDELYTDDEEDEVDEDLTSYVDETAQMIVMALERLATSELPTLPPELLQRLSSVPDLTLMDLTEEDAQPAVVYDLSTLREAAEGELRRRG